MLVTLPIVLLLLDRWPLRRGTKVLEKLPFLVVSMAASVVTYMVHQKAGATAAMDVIPQVVRVGNSLVSYTVYILNMLWPANLAVFYPYPHPWGSLWVPAASSGIALGAVTAMAVRVFPRWPYLTFGWLWYLVTLLPVIGLIQAGAQARADRYTYLPAIGLAIAFVWGAAEALQRWPRARIVLAITVCSASLILTRLQLQYWRDSVTLYQHAIDVTTGNYLAHFNLASVLEARGDAAQAVEQLREAVRARPYFAPAHAELGQLLARRGQPEDGLRELQAAVALKPDSADAHFRMGSVLGKLGRNDDAAAEFSLGLRFQPDDADGHYNLGIALVQEGKLQEGVREFSAAVRLRPGDVDAHFGLGMALARLGRLDDSISELSKVVRIQPGLVEARQALEETMRLKRESGKK
jgi:tetratricopeptide (TPR) repeat protein